MNQKSLDFEEQEFVVDWISFKYQDSQCDQNKIAKYFDELGFNSFQIDSSSIHPISESLKNKFKMFFDNSQKYWSGTVISFGGLNVKYFYKLVKEGSIDWEILDNTVLSRFDIYFSEKINTKNSETIRLFFKQCETKLERNLFKFENNPKRGKILRIGNRRSNSYARIYQKNIFLRFEYEMKGKLIGNLFHLLQCQDLITFESEITKSFLTFFAKKLPLDLHHTQWLIIKLRPFRKNYSLPLRTDYIAHDKLEHLKDQKNLVIF